MPLRRLRQIYHYLHGKYCVRNFGRTDDQHPKNKETLIIIRLIVINRSLMRQIVVFNCYAFFLFFTAFTTEIRRGGVKKNNRRKNSIVYVGQAENIIS